MNLLASIVDYGKTIHTAIDRRRSSKIAIVAGIAYARLFLNIGPAYYSLFSFDQKSIKMWSDYILDKEANEIIKTLNTIVARQIVTDKLAFYLRLSAGGFPTIPVIAVILKPADRISRSGFVAISTVDQFERYVDGFPDELFFKTVDGAHGDDAFAATRQCGRWAFCGETGEASDLYAHCVRALGNRRGWLVQGRVRAHEKLSKSLSPNALATVRVVTVLNRNNVDIVAAALKIPVGQSVTDNFSAGASGNIVAPIDLETGRLSVGQISKSRSWPDIFAIDRHPDTGCQISGLELPYWNEVVDLASDSQRELKEAPTLGWDIAITDAGPLVVEANAGYSVEIHEVAEQRGLRSVFTDAWNCVDAS